MEYDLRDGNPGSRIPMDNDEEPDAFEIGDAAAFRLGKSAGGYPALGTLNGYNYNKAQYILYLVACDGNYRRGYMKLIINNTRTGDGNGNDNGNSNGNSGGNDDNNDGNRDDGTTFGQYAKAVEEHGDPEFS